MSDRILHKGEWHIMTSCWCGVHHSVPAALYDSAEKGAPNISVYCPYGHQWVRKEKQALAREEELRRERDRLKQQLAQKDDEIRHQRDRKEQEQRRVVAYKGIVTKTKKRIAAGVCPCCNRTFQNLANHMANKHADYQKQEEVA